MLTGTSGPRGSQLASLVSRQSREVSDRAALMKEHRRLERELEGEEIARPERWTGYRIVPSRIEFWTRREPRLHHRELFRTPRRRLDANDPPALTAVTGCAPSATQPTTTCSVVMNSATRE